MNWYRIAQRQPQGQLYQQLMALRPQFAQAAQKVYNEWEQDSEGMDPMLGAGGICQDIADEISSVVSANGVGAYIVSAQCGEQHVWCIAYNDQEAYDIDIEPSEYERGGGYNWKKIPDVKFDANHVGIYPAERELADAIRSGKDIW